MTLQDTPAPAMSVPRLIAGAVLIAGVVLGVVFFRERFSQFLGWAGGMGLAGALLIVLLYIAACVLMLPGAPLTLAVGAIFGVWTALPIVSAGATLGACAAFLVGRFIARDWISRRLADRPKFAAVDRAVGDKGFTIVLLTRLSPVFPFNLQNYLYALTGISFWKYALASWLGMLPGALMYVYLGAVFGQAAQGEKTTAQWMLYTAGLAATIGAAILVARIARGALARAVEPENSTTTERESS